MVKVGSRALAARRQVVPWLPSSRILKRKGGWHERVRGSFGGILASFRAALLLCDVLPVTSQRTDQPRLTSSCPFSDRSVPPPPSRCSRRLYRQTVQKQSRRSLLSAAPQGSGGLPDTDTPRRHLIIPCLDKEYDAIMASPHDVHTARDKL